MLAVQCQRLAVGNLRVTMAFNATKLRLSEVGPFERMWNRLIEEISRNVITSVTSPLLLSGGDVGGQRLGIKMPYVKGTSSNLTSPYPWQIFQWTPAAPAEAACAYTYWRNVRVHLGYVNGITTTAAKKVHELDPNLPTGSNAGSDYDILVPQSTTAYKIYGHATYTREPYCSQQEGSIEILTVKIEHGTGWWTGHPAQYPTAGNFYFEIATCTTDADSKHIDAACPGYNGPGVAIAITQIATSDQTIIAWQSLDVTLAVSSGTGGDATTAGNYKYKATDCCAKIVGNELSPLNSRARAVAIQLVAATKGVVRLDCSGNVVLWDCDETNPEEACI